ncbi:hypothetical protein Droror1_Dr00026060 [Drosera rotundifolia]
MSLDNSDQTQIGNHVRLMCSFGGKILPRPHDNQLRYIGGDTRIVSVPRATTYAALHTKLSKTAGVADVAIKYQLPSEELDALVTVASDEDVENMMDEIDRSGRSGGGGRMRVFLFKRSEGGEDSRGSSISSLLDGSSHRESWFLDTLNNGGGGGDEGGGGGGGGKLERERSEVSSVVSELPDYLFGLECLDHESKSKIRPGLPETVGSDTDSPVPVNITSPFSSGPLTPVSRSMGDLPPVKTKPEGPMGSGLEQSESGFQDLSGQVQEPAQYMSAPPVWGNFPGQGYPGHMAQAMHMYYMPGSAPIAQGGTHVQPMPVPRPYLQPYQVQSGQVPLGYHPMIPGPGPTYGGSMRPTYVGSTRMVPTDPYMQARTMPVGLNQPLYYGINNETMVPSFPGSAVPIPENDVPGAAPAENANANWIARN